MGSSSPSYINTVEYIFTYKARAEVPLWTVHAEYRGCALRDSSSRGDASVTLSLGSVAIPQSHFVYSISIAGILISGMVTTVYWSVYKCLVTKRPHAFIFQWPSNVTTSYHSLSNCTLHDKCYRHIKFYKQYAGITSDGLMPTGIRTYSQ